MPELPDVAAFKKYLDSTALHQTIQHTSVTDRRILGDTTPQALGRRLKGTQLDGTRRHGKFLFAHTTGGGWLVLHFGMSGELRYYKDESDELEYARVILSFANGTHLAYTSRRMLGVVDYAEDLEEFIRREGLGPDALSKALDEGSFVETLGSHRRMLKPLLMDQTVVAGIGNIWADELLFQTGLHPKTRASDVDRETLGRLYQNMRHVLGAAVSRQGLLRKLSGQYLLAHRDEDHRCPACGGELATVRISNRTSHFCPRCQPRA